MKRIPSTISHLPLTLGFSPCPNDCFIFHAMLHGKVDTEGLKFKAIIEDVEALNRRAAHPDLPEGKATKKQLDITKISFFAFSQVQDKYSLLDSGSALGFGVGPLVVSTLNLKLLTSNLRVAIPGKNTTANLLFSLAYPKLKNKIEVLFSEIEDAVLKGKFDLGVIIHESRFTYKQKGLKKVIDLGNWWEKKTKSPIPLGGIAINKSFPKEIQKKVERIIRRSVEFAFANPNSSKAFIKKNAQEMDDEVIKQHIHLYVNKYSISLGTKGRKAVSVLLRKIAQIKDK
ncbi:MAG: 1,4-dihydroxy-6-naphthoate synthase [Bacteroidetes bacterium]|nr:1,4-dihydroxy-6-naphthoate synthase [Bacteroidota bacterium]